MKHSNITVSSGKLQFAELIKAHFYTPFGVPCEHPLPLPLGEMAERSECPKGKYPGIHLASPLGRGGRAQRVPDGEKYPGIHLASPLGRGGRAQRVPEGEKYPGIHLASPLGRGGRAQRGRRGQPMTIPKDNAQLENARRLRREMTPHERKLWYLFLRKYPVKIYKQRIIGRFIVDFYCASAGLVIELDGSQHYEPQGLAYDAERSQFLMSLGLEILRFSNRDIDRNFRGVCTQIDLIIRKRLQDPLSHLR